MILNIALTRFYSRGDERRLFLGFKEIPAIRSVQGVGRELLLDIEVAALGKEAMRELLALLWRYGIPLAPLRAFADKKKFSWLDDEQGYWHSAMFKESKPVSSARKIKQRPATPSPLNQRNRM